MAHEHKIEVKGFGTVTIEKRGLLYKATLAVILRTENGTALGIWRLDSWGFTAKHARMRAIREGWRLVHG